MELRLKFWSVEEFETDIRKECENDFKKATFFTKLFLNYGIFVIIIYLLQPILIKQLPLVLYIPPSCSYFLFIIFFFITPGAMAALGGADTLFYATAVSVSIQLKLLAHKFEDFGINVKNNQSEKLKKLVDYHNFLIL